MHEIEGYKTNERLASWWTQRLKGSLELALRPVVSTGIIHKLLIFDILCLLSVSKGNSSSLMKAAANRRRSKQQIEEEKQREELQRQQTAARLANMEQME